MEEITLLGLVEAARRLSLTVDTVRYLADTGEIPCMRDSARRRLFFPADISRYHQRRSANRQTRRR